MENEHLIHLKFEYAEALESKKDLLYSEKKAVILEGIISRYRLLRMEEIKTKFRLQKKIKEVVGSLKKMQKTLPKIKIPDVLKGAEGEKEEMKPRPGFKAKKSDDIESQLQEIQRKLNLLQG